MLLDTEPAVRAPTTELPGTGRERGREVMVRVSDPNGRTPEYLTVEAQYESGEPNYARIQGDSYRFAPEAGRRIVAMPLDERTSRGRRRFTPPSRRLMRAMRAA